MSFERAVSFVLDREGAYSSNPADAGGETSFGISKRSYPHLDIKALTREDAIAIYKRDFWDALHCDELPEPVALMVFDSAVNQGQPAAVIALQKALGFTGSSVDGILGPITASVARSKDIRGLVENLAAERALLYAKNTQLSVFGRGWFRRLFACFEAALTL